MDLQNDKDINLMREKVKELKELAERNNLGLILSLTNGSGNHTVSTTSIKGEQLPSALNTLFQTPIEKAQIISILSISIQDDLENGK